MHTNCWLKLWKKVNKSPLRSGDPPPSSAGRSAVRESENSSIEDIPGGAAGEDLDTTDLELAEPGAEPLKTEEDVKNEADAEIIKYLERRLKTYTFATRKELQDKFNEIYHTKRFQNNLPPVGNIRADPLQRRILRKWGEIHSQDATVAATSQLAFAAELYHFCDVKERT